jgi:arylsulfatase A-like enzyme
MQTWTEEHWSELRGTYYGMCARVDYQFSLILAALREAGIYDETAIFFFADHGEFAGDYGLVEKTQNTFEECLTRVPLLVKPPSSVSIKPGVRNALVELIDVPATIEALTGIVPRHTHFGRSLVPLLTGETQTGRDAVFCEGGRRHGETHAMELESPASQSPEALYWPRVGLQRSEGPEHTLAVMCRTQDFKYVRRLYESDELYDLRTDPQELHNLIDDPTYAHTIATLKERLLTFYQETCDVVPHAIDRRGSVSLRVNV